MFEAPYDYLYRLYQMKACIKKWYKCVYDFLLRFVSSLRFSVQRALHLTKLKLLMTTSIVFTK